MLGLERAPQAPPRAPEVGHREQVLAEGRGSHPAAGLTKPLRTLKNVVLPAPFGPMRPQVPPGKTTLTSSSGVTPAKRTVRLLTSITAPSSPPPPARAAPRRACDQPPEPGQILRELVGEPAGGGQQHLEEPDAEDDQEEVRVDAPLRLEEERHALLKRPATIAPQRLKMPPISAVAASVSESCVWNVIARGDADLCREQAARDAGHERREREGPELVQRDVHAGGERGRLALADRRPRAARLARDMEQREQEQDRADDHGVAVVRDVRCRPRRPAAPGACWW